MTPSFLALSPAIIVAAIVFSLRKAIDYLLSPYISHVLQNNYAEATPAWLLAKWTSTLKRRYIFTQYEIDEHVISGYFRKMQSHLHVYIPHDINSICLQHYHDTSKLDLTENQCSKIINLVQQTRPGTYQYHPSIDKLIELLIKIDLPSEQESEFKRYYTSIQDVKKYTKRLLARLSGFGICVAMFIYGIYVLLFKHDFLINHKKQWLCFNEDSSFIQAYDQWIQWYFILKMGVVIANASHNYKKRNSFITVYLPLTLDICFWMSGMVRTGAISIFLDQSPSVILKLYWILLKCCGENSMYSFAVSILFCMSFIGCKLLMYGQKVWFQIWFYGVYKSSVYYYIVYGAVFIQQVMHIYVAYLILLAMQRRRRRKRKSE